MDNIAIINFIHSVFKYSKSEFLIKTPSFGIKADCNIGRTCFDVNDKYYIIHNSDGVTIPKYLDINLLLKEIKENIVPYKSDAFYQVVFIDGVFCDYRVTYVGLNSLILTHKNGDLVEFSGIGDEWLKVCWESFLEHCINLEGEKR